MFAVLLVYAGLIAGFLGLVSILKPLMFVGLATRGQSAWLLGGAVLVALVGWHLPAIETRVATPRSHLDEFVPAYQFNEFHAIRVNASKDRVYAVIKNLRPNEILLFQTLAWMRRFGKRGPESVLNAPDNVPILEVATRTRFLLLAEEPEREIVIGTVVLRPPGAQPLKTPADFRNSVRPGFAVAAMNFHVEDAGENTTLVTTETRVYAADDVTRRRFAGYWRTIYPGSAFIRRMWLRAVKHRAESVGS